MHRAQLLVGPGRVVEPAVLRIDHRARLVSRRLREIANQVALRQPDVAQRLENDPRRRPVREAIGPRPRLPLRELVCKADRLVDLAVHRRAKGHLAHLARLHIDGLDPAPNRQVQVRPVRVPVHVGRDAVVVRPRLLVIAVEPPHQHLLRARPQVVDQHHSLLIVAVAVRQVASVGRQRGVEGAAGRLAIHPDLAGPQVVGIDAGAALMELAAQVLVEEDIAQGMLLEVRDRLEGRARGDLLARAEEVEAVGGHPRVLLERRRVDRLAVGRPRALHHRQRHPGDVLDRVGARRIPRAAMQDPHVLAPAPVGGERDPRPVRAVARETVPRTPAGERDRIAAVDRHLVDVPEQLEGQVTPVRRDIHADPGAFRSGVAEGGGGRSPRFLDAPLARVLGDGGVGQGGDQGEGRDGRISWHGSLRCYRNAGSGLARAATPVFAGPGWKIRFTASQ